MNNMRKLMETLDRIEENTLNGLDFETIRLGESIVVRAIYDDKTVAGTCKFPSDNFMLLTLASMGAGPMFTDGQGKTCSSEELNSISDAVEAYKIEK